jgi:hypothetical protein
MALWRGGLLGNWGRGSVNRSLEKKVAKGGDKNLKKLPKVLKP